MADTQAGSDEEDFEEESFFAEGFFGSDVDTEVDVDSPRVEDFL